MALRPFDLDFEEDAVDVEVATTGAAVVAVGLAVGTISWGDRDDPRLLRAFDGLVAVPPAPLPEGFCPFRGVAWRLSVGLPSCRCLLILLPPVPASCGCAELERPASRI